MEAALLPLGLRRRHYAALCVIAEEGPLTQQELSLRIPIDRVAMVSVMDDLEASGLAERRKDPSDRRVWRLVLDTQRPAVARAGLRRDRGGGGRGVRGAVSVGPGAARSLCAPVVWLGWRSVMTGASVPPQIWFDDMAAGMSLPGLVKGPMTTMHIMRWSAAMENWHRIHFDQPFARDVDGLPDVLVNGSWKQHVLVQLMKDFTGHQGWLWRIRSVQFRDMDPAGNTIIAGGTVEECAAHDGLGYARCTLHLTNQLDKMTTQGAAIGGCWPLRGGRQVALSVYSAGSVPRGLVAV